MDTTVRQPEAVEPQAQDFTPPEKITEQNAYKFSVDVWQDRQSPALIASAVIPERTRAILPDLILTNAGISELEIHRKDAGTRLTEIINTDKLKHDGRSGISLDQRTALNIQRFIRNELRSGVNPEALATALKTLPGPWQIRLERDARGRDQFVIAKTDDKGAKSDFAIMRTSDVVAGDTKPETYLQTGARLAERLDVLRDNPAMLKAYIQGVADFIKRLPPGDARNEFIRGFNERLQANPQTKQFEIQIQKDSANKDTALVLADKSGSGLLGDQNKIEKPFLTAGQESEAALRRLFTARQAEIAGESGLKVEFFKDTKLPKTITIGQGGDAQRFELDEKALASGQLIYKYKGDAKSGFAAFEKHILPALQKASLVVTENQNGQERIQGILKPNGERLEFKYGEPKDALGRTDGLSSIIKTSKDGTIETWNLQADGITWRKDGAKPGEQDTWVGFKRIDPKTGILTETGYLPQDGKEPVILARAFKPDGTADQPVVDDGVTEKERPIVRETRLAARLATIEKALEGPFDTNKANILREQLRDLSAEEIQILKHLHEQKTQDPEKNLESRLKEKFKEIKMGLDSFQWMEVQGHLKRIGAPGEREAIQLIVDAAESQLTFGKDRQYSEIRATTRRILGSATEERRGQIDESLARIYGTNLSKIYSDEGLGRHILNHDDYHKRLIEVAAQKGVGARTAEEEASILKSAITASVWRSTTLEYIREAAGQSFLTDAGRKEFQKQGGLKLLEQNLGPDGSFLDAREAFDYVRNGTISEETLFLKAVNTVTGNEDKEIENAFKNLTVEKRLLYARGKVIADGIKLDPSKQPKEGSPEADALKYYQQWQEVFRQAHHTGWRNTRKAHEYEAMILFPENGVLKEITDVGGQFFSWHEQHNRGLKWNEKDFGWLITGLEMRDGKFVSPFAQALSGAMRDNFSRHGDYTSRVEDILQKRLSFVKEVSDILGSDKTTEAQKINLLAEKIPGFANLKPEQQKETLALLIKGQAIQSKLDQAVISDKQPPVVAESKLSEPERRLLDAYRKILLEATQQSQARNLAQAITDNNYFSFWSNKYFAQFEAIRAMTPAEREAYRESKPYVVTVDGRQIEVKDYRKYVDDLLDSVMGKDSIQREAAKSLLSQLENGKPDKPIEETVAFKLLKTILQSGDGGWQDNKTFVVATIAQAIAQDKALGAKLEQDPLFKQTIKKVLGWDPEHPEFKTYIEPLLRNEVLPANLLKDLFTQKIVTKERSPYIGQADIEKTEFRFLQDAFIKNYVLNLNPDNIKFLNSNLQEKEAFLALLNPAARAFVQNLLQKGEVKLEDKARAFTLGLAYDKSEFQALFTDLAPAARLRVSQNYEATYGTLLKDDAFKVLGARDQKTFEYLLRPNEWTSDEAYINTLLRVADTAYSSGATFGTNHNTELLRILTNIEKLRQEHSGEIPKEILQAELKKVDQAIKEFIASKHDTIEKTVDAIVTLASIAASFITGGASLAMLAKLAHWAKLGKISLAGGVLGTALKAAIEGKDFEAKEILGDFLKYTVLTGGNLLGAEAILAPIAAKLGTRLVANVFKGAEREILVDGKKVILSEASAQAFRSGLRKLVGEGLEGRITSLDHSIEVLLKGLKTEGGDLIDAALIKGLSGMVKGNLDTLIKISASHFISGLLIRGAFESQTSAFASFSGELIEELVKEGKLDPEKLQMAVAMGLLLGFGGRIGFESVLGGSTRLVQKARSRHQPIEPETEIANLKERGLNSKSQPEPSLAKADEIVDAQALSPENILKVLRQKSEWSPSFELVFDKLFKARAGHIEARRKFDQGLRDVFEQQMKVNPKISFADLTAEVWKAFSDLNHPLNNSGTNLFALKQALQDAENAHALSLAELRRESPALFAAYKTEISPRNKLNPIEAEVNRLVGELPYHTPNPSEIALLKRLTPNFDEASAKEFFAIFDRNDLAWLKDHSQLVRESYAEHAKVEILYQRLESLRREHKKLASDPSNPVIPIHKLQELRQAELEWQLAAIKYAFLNKEVFTAAQTKFKLIVGAFDSYLEARGLRRFDLSLDTQTPFGGYYSGFRQYKGDPKFYQTLTISAQHFLSPDVFQDLPRIMFHELVHHHQTISSIRLSLQKILGKVQGARRFGDIPEDLVSTHLKELQTDFFNRRGVTLDDETFKRVLKYSKDVEFFDANTIVFIQKLDADALQNSGHAHKSQKHLSDARVIARTLAHLKSRDLVREEELAKFLGDLMQGTPKEYLDRHGLLKRGTAGERLAQRVFGTHRIPDYVRDMILDRMPEVKLSADGRSLVITGEKVPLSTLPESEARIRRTIEYFRLVEQLKERLNTRLYLASYYNHYYNYQLIERHAYGLETSVGHLRDQRYRELMRN